MRVEHMLPTRATRPVRLVHRARPLLAAAACSVTLARNVHTHLHVYKYSRPQVLWAVRRNAQKRLVGTRQISPPWGNDDAKLNHSSRRSSVACAHASEQSDGVVQKADVWSRHVGTRSRADAMG